MTIRNSAQNFIVHVAVSPRTHACRPGYMCVKTLFSCFAFICIGPELISALTITCSFFSLYFFFAFCLAHNQSRHKICMFPFPSIYVSSKRFFHLRFCSRNSSEGWNNGLPKQTTHSFCTRKHSHQFVNICRYRGTNPTVFNA